MKYVIIAMIIWWLPNINIGSVSASTPIKSTYPSSHVLTRQELLWMYTMKTRFWSDGARITVFYHKLDGKTHRDFCNEVLGITTERFNIVVNTYLTRGNADYFKQVDSDIDMVHEVSTHPGSIGYVSTKEVLVNTGEAVEIIKVIR